MTTVTLKLPRPHAAQQEVLNDPSRYKVIVWGRRTGKTELFNHVLVLGHGGRQAAIHGLPVAYLSMTYKNVLELWGRLKSTYSDLIEDKNEVQHKLTLKTGGSVECWTMEKAFSVRGRAYAGVIIDEAAYTPSLQDKWLRDIQPMLLDYQGWAMFGSTPNGLDDFYALYTWGEDTAKSEWASFQYSTYANPHMSRSELDNLKLSVPERVWQQEYLAEFLEDGGAVFRNLKACEYIESIAVDGNIVFGVDLGRSNDYTVIVAIDSNTGAVVDIDRFTDTAWHIQEMRLKALAEKWNPRRIFIEENFNDKFAEDMHTAGLPVQFFRTNNLNKAQIIGSLALAFEQSAISIPASELNPHASALWNELRAFTVERLPSGALKYGAPIGSHDDTVIALALAWHGATMPTQQLVYDNTMRVNIGW